MEWHCHRHPKHISEITQLLCTYAKYGRWHVKNEELAQTHGRPNCPGRQQHIAADPSQTDPTWSLYRSRDAQSRPRTTTGRTARTTVLRTVWTRGHCPHRSTFEQRETFWSFVLAPARSSVHRVPWNLHRRRRPQWSPCPPQSKPWRPCFDCVGGGWTPARRLHSTIRHEPWQIHGKRRMVRSNVGSDWTFPEMALHTQERQISQHHGRLQLQHKKRIL